MSTDREHLEDLVRAVERLAVDGHAHLRDLAARGRAHLDRADDPCAEEVARASAAAYAAGQARNAGATP